MIRLSDAFLLSGVSPVESWGDSVFSSICSDSRKVKPGCLFVVMPSIGSDTSIYIESAMAKGADCVLVFEEKAKLKASDLGIPGAQIGSTEAEFHEAVGKICREFYSDPTLDMRIIGVTGTNGKTTVAWLLKQALNNLDRPATYLGTLGYQFIDELEQLSNTTLFPVDLWAKLAEARDDGCTDLVMEVSSHALDQGRVSAVQFDMGVFTNLSQDHLDYHHTMEDYVKAKKRLFIDLPMANDKAFAAVINADDETGARWIQEWTDQDVSLSPPFLSFGFQAGSLRGNVVNVSYEGLAIEVAYAGKTSLLQASVGGSFNLENCMAVLATLLAMGVELEAACGALMELKPAPGRFETIINPLGIGIIVDYAHTEDALQKLLSSARDLGEGRVISVFGCGGDRDRTKRPKMAYASTELADMTIFTLDNPRTEDPEQIFSDLMSGAIEGRYQRVDDRKDAIRQAITMANKGDLVVIAGKGHETTQVIGREKFPCDDRLMAREVILEIAEAMGRGV